MGLNSEDKCNTVQTKIEEIACIIYCLQETKRQTFGPSMIRKVAPKSFNKFSFSPSQGASGGILIGWKDSQLVGQVIHNCRFAITTLFTSQHKMEQWKLKVVYGPCHGQERHDFVNWLNSLQIADDENWMIIRDFNFYGSLETRNKDGGICRMPCSSMK
jgi:hypothetical protein